MAMPLGWSGERPYIFVTWVVTERGRVIASLVGLRTQGLEGKCLDTCSPVEQVQLQVLQDII